MLPITIYNNTSEKFAIDINLKALGKNLLHQKSTVNNQYFVVVNQSSRPLKMRVALKTFGMRGSPILNSFVDSLQNNLDFDVFDEIDMPDEVGDYPKILSLLKTKLRLTSSKMEEALG